VHDLVVRGGVLVDGTGAPARPADVAVDDGRVVALGAVDGRARQTIHADGAVVAPGFIDVHTHYDAQVHWDPWLSPSSAHGVTTVFGGNCGFTVAPFSGRPEDADYLARMLARVEGIPLAALEASLDWTWSGFGSWLDAVDGTLGVNAGFLVGHSTLRRAVLGADHHRPATAAERSAMADLLDRSLAEGGFGFSSSWIETHTDGAGEPVPSRFATGEELLELTAVLARHPGTALEFVPGFGPFDDEQVALLVALARAAGRPLNWNILRAENEGVDQQLAIFDRAAAAGAAVIALTPSEPTAIRASLRTGLLFDNLPGWAEVVALPHGARRAALADPAVRRRLADAVVGHELRWPHADLVRWDRLTLVEVAAAELAPLQGLTVGEVARRRGVEPFDALCDVLIADDLATHLGLPARGDDAETWERRASLWRDHRTVVGGADAGAHMDVLCGASYTTSLLGHGVRERGALPLEAAVHALTRAPARMYGLHDRGVVAPGAHADLVVFDPSTVGSGPLHTRRDLPGGAARLFSQPEGIHHVVVAGAAIVSDGDPTGARPGRVLRSGVDSSTVVPSELCADLVAEGGGRR
jgi:N-acyl-D-aspartate/D-glutamate deacylase